MPDHGNGTWSCDLCREGPWEKAWSDADAAREHALAFGHLPAVDSPVVCDECYERVVRYHQGRIARKR